MHPVESYLSELEAPHAQDAASLLDTGEAISAAAARRLACEAGIIPAVLGTKSQVLDSTPGPMAAAPPLNAG